MSVRKRPRGIGSARRDPVEAVLSAHLGPARTTALMAAMSPDRDHLADACNVLKQVHGATDEALLVALYEDAGVSVRRSAQVLGVPLSWAMDRLDLEEVLDPVVEVEGPRPYRAARTSVRLVWASLFAVGAVGLVQAQGSILPCQEEVCIDQVDLLLDPDELADATRPSERDPGEVVGLRYEHRVTGSYRGTLVWTVDGVAAQVQTVVWAGAADELVLWSEGAMPAGVHRVAIVDEDPLAPVERNAITFVVRRFPDL